jgi:hypothetical protein
MAFVSQQMQESSTRYQAGEFAFVLLLFLKEINVSEVKWHILQKWTYDSDSQICVILTLGIINFVHASDNITFVFSCLVHAGPPK